MRIDQDLYERSATESIDAIFMFHGDRCLDQTRSSLIDAFADEARVLDTLADQLKEERLLRRNYFWLWLGTSVMLGCAVAALWLGITV